MICKYFLPFCGLPFHFLDGIHQYTQLFNFDEVEFIFFLFVACAFGVISKKLLPNLRSCRFIFMFSSKSCSFSSHN